MKHFDKKQHYLGQILAADPGHMRFKNAVKATAGLGFSAFTTLFLLFLMDDIQLTPVIMSGMIGMMSIIIAMDPTVAERKKTTLLLLIPSIVGMIAGTWFVENTLIINALMVIVITGGFYFSKYGSRYFSFGQMAFMTIYSAFITKMSWGDLPWMFLGVGIGIMYAYLFNFYLFRNSAKTLKHSMHAFHMQANITINLLIDSVQTTDINDQRQQQIEKHIQKLLTYTNIVIGQVNEKEIRDLWPGLEQTQVRLYVFNANLLIETLNETLYKLKKTGAVESEDLTQSLVALLTSLREANINNPTHHLAEAGEALDSLHHSITKVISQENDNEEGLFLLRRVESIAKHVIKASEAIQHTLETGESIESVNSTRTKQDSNSIHDHGKETSTTPPDRMIDKLSPSARKAIQVFIASIIAIIVGKTFTPIQPYWVLLTVFICMLGTESVGRVYKKGLQRSVGTVIGAIVGFTLAILLSGHTVSEIIFILIITFVTGYSAPVSYMLMSVFVTMTVAFMYNLLLNGVGFSIISARIIETIAGAFIAYIVAYFVFPKKTGDKIIEVSQDYLQALKPYVISYIKGLRKDTIINEPTTQALMIDKKLQQIEDEAEPIMKRTEAHSHSNVSKWINLFMAINYYTRHLLSSSQRHQLDYPETIKPVLTQVEEKVEQNIDTLNKLLSGQQPDHPAHLLDKERKQIELLTPESNLSSSNLIDNTYNIWQINHCLVDLIEGFHTSVDEEI